MLHCIFRAPRAAEVLSPDAFPDDEIMDVDSDCGPPVPHNDANFESDQATQLPADGTLDPLAAFIKELQGLSSMAGPDISDITDDLPILQQHEIESMTVHNAVEV